MKLLSLGDANPKIGKSDKAGTEYRSAIMHLSPANESGTNLCTQASPGCIDGCLYFAGRGRTNVVQEARLARTRLFLDDFETFKKQLCAEIEAFIWANDQDGFKTAVRLNGTSDVIWEKKFPELFTKYPDVQFYDYTKHAARMLPGWELPANYYLVFSRSETNEQQTFEILSNNGSVAVVFNNVPEKWKNNKVVLGEDDDLIFLKPRGVVLGLHPKGPAKKDSSGFVVQ